MAPLFVQVRDVRPYLSPCLAITFEPMELALGIVIGVALGVLVVAFLALGSYDRGFEDAIARAYGIRIHPGPR